MLYSEPVIIEGKTLKTVKRFFISAITIVSTLLVSATPVLALSVTSPSNGAALDSGSVTLQGTATANSTVTIYDGQSLLTATVADGSGDWSATLTGLGAGSHTINAKEIGQTYGYFPAISGTTTMNRILSGSTTLNPGGSPWPITTSVSYLIPIGIRPQGDTLYVGTGASAPPALFDPSSPADPTPITSYPATSPGTGAFTLDGAKLYTPNDLLDTLTVTDYATNTAVSSVAMPSGAYLSTATTAPSGNIYVPLDSGVAIVDPDTDTITKTVSTGCPTTTAGLGYVSFQQGRSYYYVPCQKDGLVERRSSTDDSLIETIDVTAAFDNVSIVFENPINNKLYVVGTYGAASQDKVAVFNSDHSLDTIITLSAATFSAVPTPDFQYMYAPTQGSFDTTNIDVIDVQTNTVIANIDTSSVGVPGVIAFTPPSVTTTSLMVTVPSPVSLASTGNNFYVVLGAASAIVLLTGYQLRRLRQQ